jgi:ubiquinone biosynthesis protein UbiJ
MAATPAWLASIEALLNRGISGSALAAELMVRLNGTALLIDIHGFKAVYAAISGGRMTLTAAGTGTQAEAGGTAAAPANATISGSPLALLQLARGASKERGSFSAAQVRGDAEIAAAYRQLFSLARPDLEEEVSQLIGDLPARRLSQLAARTLAWARNARRTAGENVAEYLQEESRDLVNRPELEEFLQGVDALRDTAERIEARLILLERRLQGAK